jgi:hypothetical protein
MSSSPSRQPASADLLTHYDRARTRPVINPEVTPRKTSVTLHERGGSVRLFDSLSEAIVSLGIYWLRDNLSTPSTFDWRDNPFPDKPAAVLKDEHSLEVSLDEIDSIVLPPYLRSSAREGRDEDEHALYRGRGPVIGTRKWRGRGHWIRRPRTTHERRLAALVLEEEGEVAPRPNRGAKTLPSAWDDIPVGSLALRNWKRYRSTQWKDGPPRVTRRAGFDASRELGRMARLFPNATFESEDPML